MWEIERAGKKRYRKERRKERKMKEENTFFSKVQKRAIFVPKFRTNKAELGD